MDIGLEDHLHRDLSYSSIGKERAIALLVKKDTRAILLIDRLSIKLCLTDRL
jgi:hypothetical protein